MSAPFFFVHVPKTGGTTFWMHVRENFPIESVYPNRFDDPNLFEAYMDVEYVRAVSPERRARTRCYSGHLPAFVVDLVAPDAVMLTVLREPVGRVVSFLKEEQRRVRPDDRSSLEAVYETWRGTPYVTNQQYRLFAPAGDSGVRTFLDDVAVDAAGLERAKAYVDRADVLGLHDHYDEFLAELTARFGWVFGDVGNRRVGQDASLSSALRARIVADNEADLALYDYACRSHDARRRRARS